MLSLHELLVSLYRKWLNGLVLELATTNETQHKRSFPDTVMKSIGVAKTV